MSWKLIRLLSVIKFNRIDKSLTKIFTPLITVSRINDFTPTTARSLTKSCNFSARKDVLVMTEVKVLGLSRLLLRAKESRKIVESQTFSARWEE